jgi:methylmalonyl-CoA/ethylmalonyl-CoA epimerase
MPEPNAPGAPLALDLGRPHHSAYVVEDIEATVARMVAELGAGPFFLIEDVPLEDVVAAGAPARLDHHSAFGSLGGYPIELMQILAAEPEPVAARFAGPLPRLHHVGYGLAPEAADAARSTLGREYLSSRLGDGHGTFHDLAATLGHDVEIQDTVGQFPEFFAMVLGAAEGWDGSEPLRRVG